MQDQKLKCECPLWVFQVAYIWGGAGTDFIHYFLYTDDVNSSTHDKHASVYVKIPYFIYFCLKVNF